jgi:sterol desaturase/sphingolipid hydroxylase (fatty acid hydroxylase superfamily)
VGTEDKFWLSAQAGLGRGVGDLLWYALLAGAAWLAFWVLFRRALKHRRVSQREPSAGQIRWEVLRSLRSMAVFALVTAAVVFAALAGWTRLYARVDEYGWSWLVSSVGVMVVMHDAYFYWTHRLMHSHPRLFRLFHRTHHLSASPTPWAAYSFSVPEAFVQAGIGPLIVFTIPTHPLAFAAFMLWQVAFNVLGHCGHEIFPRWFTRTWAGKVLNSVTHHGLHHERFGANYGLYFNVWDRLMRTNHPDYEARFHLAAGGAARGAGRGGRGTLPA